MFNVHNSFIEALMKKGYVSDTAYLFKEGAIWDRDMWQYLYNHGSFSEFLKLFFLMGLGSGEEEKLIKWLNEDKAFGVFMLMELTQHLYVNRYEDRRKHILNGDLPMPYAGVQASLARVFEAVLGTLPITQMLSEGNAVEASDGTSWRYRYGYGSGEDVALKFGLPKFDNVYNYPTLMIDYALLNQKKMVFYENFSNFRKYGLAERNSGFRHRGTKDSSAFNCNDITKVPEFIGKLYNIKTLWVPANTLPYYEYLACSKRTDVKTEHELSLIGHPTFTLYITHAKLGISCQPESNCTFTFNPVLITDRMKLKNRMNPQYYLENRPAVETGVIRFGVTSNEANWTNRSETETVRHQLEDTWAQIEIPVEIKNYTQATMFDGLNIPAPSREA